ncbi:MAG: CPBP family intramembrane metalloprotease [Deltaproteobacteria bacterium]|nr:CPBP family intramembrane metalloprotease [Deltaproteobacteria bacterium]
MNRFPRDAALTVLLLCGTYAMGNVLPLGPVASIAGYALLLYAPLWHERQGRITFARMAGDRALAWKGAGTGLIAAMLICTGFYLLWSVVPGGIPWVGQPGTPDFTRIVTTHALALIVLYPLAEELFFRGYLQARLEDSSWSPWGAITVQAALFGLVHALSFANPAGLMTFFPALVMGVLRRRTGTLAAPLVFHMVANGLIVIV